MALLPLGVLALFGTVQSIRTAEAERVSALNLSAAEGAIRLLEEINADRSTVRLVADYLDSHPAQTDICSRAKTQLQARTRGFAFALFAADGRALCRLGAAPARYSWGGNRLADQQASITTAPSDLTVRIRSTRGGVMGLMIYAPDALARMTHLRGLGDGFLGLTLNRGGLELPLMSEKGKASPPGLVVDRTVVALNLGEIRFTMLTERPPVDVLRFGATSLPLLMWFAAAAVGWWVVNRHLIRPLIDLNTYVAAYQPGTVLGPRPSSNDLAQEITTLGETFREIAEDVAEHDAQLADALVSQRALMREVHHRVKNNLQIIASLINLHSRSSTLPEVADAYASIQRRVDALSVVHRNHYAAVEYTQGIDGQALISELSSGLRASAPDGHFIIRVAGDTLYLSQDVAVPTAFLITELVEMVIVIGHARGQASPVLVALRLVAGESDMAELSVASEGLKPSPEAQHLLDEQFQRVLTGLSRQLRAPLDYDPALGRYSIRVTVKT